MKNQKPDFAVREVEASRPLLREELRWTVQEVRGTASYLLEDPLQGKFYRFGRREYEFVNRLDGRMTVSSLVAQLSKGNSALALGAEEAEALVRMLADSGLLRSSDSSHAERVWDEVNRPNEGKRVLGKVSQILFLRIPLCNPDRFFSWLAMRFGWLVGPWFALLWAAVLLTGIASISGEKERFLAQMSGVFDFGNLWILGGLWVILKAFHECWHGLACRRFGGAVPEAGISLLLFATPLGYVDASSSAAFPSRWHRMIVSAAGMYGEIFLASIAAILWAHLEPGLLSETLHRVIVLSSVTTVVFNINPLMRFDGYYLLSDWLDIPNLYGKGQNFVQWFFRRWILGMKKARNPLRKGDPHLSIMAYGVAAWIWKVILMTGILIATAFLFERLGLIIAITTAVAMIIQNVIGIRRYLRKSAASEGLHPARVVLRVTGIVCVMIALLSYVEIRPSAKAPAVVRDIVGGETRVNCPGFLTELAVSIGQKVAAGELLARLENPEQTAKLKQIESEIERSRVIRDSWIEKGEIAAAQAESENEAALEEIATDLRNYVGSLELRAPREGTVDSRHPELLIGTWIESGRELFSIVDYGRRELVALVAEEDKESFEEALRVGGELDFRPQGRLGTWSALLSERIPRASVQPPHFAFITAAGGPLPVKNRVLDGEEENRAARDGDADQAADRYELVRPRFEFRAELDESNGILRAGEMGNLVAQAGKRRNLAEWGKAELVRYFDGILEKANR